MALPFIVFPNKATANNGRRVYHRIIHCVCYLDDSVLCLHSRFAEARDDPPYRSLLEELCVAGTLVEGVRSISGVGAWTSCVENIRCDEGGRCGTEGRVAGKGRVVGWGSGYPAYNAVNC